MKALRNYLDKIKPNFEEGGKLAMFRSVFEGVETFLFVPSTTSKSGVHIHDYIDSKRTMTVVIIALLPALLFGMYNVGYQHNLAVGADPGFLMTFIFGFLAVLPKIIVSYVVGLGIEFAVAQVKKEEIQALEEAYAKHECPVVSNNSAHRWTPDVPMIIPEVRRLHFWGWCLC